MKLKGGRGHVAPYQTKMERVPVPMQPQVKVLVESYREFISVGGDPNLPPDFLSATPAIDQLQQQLAEIKKQRDELDFELNELHGQNGNLNLKVETLKQALVENEGKSGQALDRAITLLQEAITSKAFGGVYAPNNATGVRKLVEKALAILKE